MKARCAIRVAVAAAGLCAASAGTAAPDVQEWTTAAGTRVLFVETHEIPAVDVRMTFAAGAARDGEHPHERVADVGHRGARRRCPGPRL